MMAKDQRLDAQRDSLTPHSGGMPNELWTSARTGMSVDHTIRREEDHSLRVPTKPSRWSNASEQVG
jgi:hypothetical protein